MIATVSYISAYLFFAISGATLMKYGGLEHVKKIFTIPLINMEISFITIMGFACYGISFILYFIILSKYNISFVSIFSVGVIYILLMIVAFLVFKEPITTTKIVGSAIMLIGIAILLLNK